jgi:peptidoglycan-N-acetylglucosamine deacetylase
MRYSIKSFRRLYGTITRTVLGTITHVATQDPVAALTFDDGPHPEYTPRLLEILEKHHAHATFFMLGEAAKKYPNLVWQVANGGHVIGNHSWDHPSFPLLSGCERRAQIQACASAIAPYGGQHLFRPPYGHQNLASRIDALWLGYRVVTWNVVAEDWCDRDAEWMANRLVKQIRPGSVIILHDAIYRSVQVVPQHDRQRMLTALDMTLVQLGERFRFVTIPELLQHGQPQRQAWCRHGGPELLPLLMQHPLLIRKSSGTAGLCHYNLTKASEQVPSDIRKSFDANQ